MDRVSRTFGVMMLDKGLFQVLHHYTVFATLLRGMDAQQLSCYHL